MTLLSRGRRDDGASALELAMLLPILLLMLTAAAPLVQAGIGYMTMSRAAATGVRYASRVDENARYGPDGKLTRRPTAGEVEEFVRDAASPLSLTTVDTYVSGEPGDPAQSLPGESIAVVVSYELSLGPLVEAANAVAGLIGSGSGGVLPESRTVTVSAAGRQE